MPALLREPTARSPEISVTPLIDVLLVLLVVFFLINVMRLRLVQDLPLPSPAGGEGLRSSQVVLDLRADGSFAVNEQPVPASEVAGYLGEVFAGRPSKLLFIRADTSRTYQDVIDAMDAARGAGVQSIALMPDLAR